ncbi:hypothetical protein X759_35245 [Mesorhizobium sp. LSHC420B00]|nr:hypothetical protein X759_35245 [Mesorhizobium sp. LSHC420B00]
MIIQFLECRTFVDLQDLDPALRQISHEASKFLFPGAKVEGRPIIAGGISRPSTHQRVTLA